MNRVPLVLSCGVLCVLPGAAGAQPEEPAARGACCLPTGQCVVIPENACLNAGGTYEGDDTDCESSDCGDPAPGCPCDWNDDDSLDSNDIRDFIRDWVAGEGDFNDDDFNNSADIRAFLQCWIGGCDE